MMKEMIFNKKKNAVMMMLIFAAALLLTVLTSYVTAEAAGVGQITAKQESLTLAAGETASVLIVYSDVAGGFGDLAVLSADGGIAAAALTDGGNNTAVLTVTATGMGSTVIAVYRITNPAVVGYVTVRCGLAQKGEVYTQMDGSSLTTVYEDRIITYNSLLNGKNGAQLAVSGLSVERESGIDCLKVAGSLWERDSKTPGMNVFYAQFYDASGSLIKQQAYYARNPVSGQTITLEWYIPEGCTNIVLE